MPQGKNMFSIYKYAHIKVSIQLSPDTSAAKSLVTQPQNCLI